MPASAWLFFAHPEHQRMSPSVGRPKLGCLSWQSSHFARPIVVAPSHER
jgi:hypothetical protein